MLLHEDYPHTVPTRAYLKWKENYFWVYMDTERDISFLAHCTCEPTYGKAFASCTLIHDGKTYTTAREVPMPDPFEHAKELKLDYLTLRFLKPQAEFQVEFRGTDLDITLNFKRRMHLYDFSASSDLNPDLLSISELVAFNRGDFHHQGQSITGSGVVSFKTGPKAGTEIKTSGIGYRDHSWGMRNDQLTLDHNWTFVNFPDLTFHVMRVRNFLRPGIQVFEGYVGNADGNRALKKVEITNIGDGPEKMPETVRYDLLAYDDARYTIVADVGKSFARLPLFSQKPGEKTTQATKKGYFMVENMCPCRLEETGAQGLANVEIGALIEV